MHQRHALDAARQIERPRHRIGIDRIDSVDRGHFGLGQIRVPAKLLQARQREFRIAVLKSPNPWNKSRRQQADLPGRAVRQLLLTLDAKTRAERAAAVHHMQIGIVEQRRAGMPDFGRAPARPGQAVIVTADFRIVLRRPHGHQIELGLVLHVRLEAFRRLTAIAGRPAAAVHLAKHILCFRQIVLDLDVFEHLVGESELLRH